MSYKNNKSDVRILNQLFLSTTFQGSRKKTSASYESKTGARMKPVNLSPTVQLNLRTTDNGN